MGRYNPKWHVMISLYLPMRYRRRYLRGPFFYIQRVPSRHPRMFLYMEGRVPRKWEYYISDYSKCDMSTL